MSNSASAKPLTEVDEDQLLAELGEIAVDLEEEVATEVSRVDSEQVAQNEFLIMFSGRQHSEFILES